jgi:hypothetical protein
MTLYCAIDLNSSKNGPVVIDDDDKILFLKRLPNDLSIVLSCLSPFKSGLYADAVESAFYWCWLVDG